MLKKKTLFNAEMMYDTCGEILDTGRSKAEAIYRALPVSLSPRQDEGQSM
jgi:hypothetical protein